MMRRGHRQSFYQHGAKSRWHGGVDLSGVPIAAVGAPAGFGRGWRRFRKHRSETQDGWASQPPVTRKSACWKAAC